MKTTFEGTQIVILVAAACWLFGFSYVSGQSDALGFSELKLTSMNLHYLIAIGFMSFAVPLLSLSAVSALVTLIILYALPFGLYILVAKKNKTLAKVLCIWFLVLIHSAILFNHGQTGVREQALIYNQYFSDPTTPLTKEKINEDGKALSTVRYFHPVTKEEFTVSGFEIIDVDGFDYFFSKQGIIGIPTKNIINIMLKDPYSSPDKSTNF